MNNTNHQQQIIEIDLKEVFWKLLSQWKAVLLVALLMAGLTCGAKYAVDTRTYNASIDAQIEASKQEKIPAKERIENLLSDFSDSERETVEYVVHEKEWLAKQKEYANNSVLMQTDPTNQRVLKQIYDLDMENSDDYPVMIRSFLAYIRDDECIERIKVYIDPEAENKYIGELFYSYDSKKEIESEMVGKGDALELNLVLPEDVNADAVADALNAAVAEYSREMAARYPHTIAIAEQKVVYVYHTDNTYKYTKTFNDINYLESVIKTAEGTLSAKQKEAVETILKINAGEENGIQIADNTEGDDTANANGITAPTLSKKHALLGFLLGIFMYAAAYVILLVFKSTAFSASTVASFTGTRMLGEVYYDGKPNGLLKAFHSRLVAKYRYRGKLDEVMQINRISESIDAICEHNGTKNLTVLSACSATEVVKNLKEGISAKGIDVAVVEVGEDFDEKSLLAVDNAVLAIGADTKVSKLAQLMSLCSEYDSSILGSVYMSSY